MQIAGPPAPESLRRDQHARRQRMIKVAMAALMRGTYDDVKMSAVAKGSGVALGTLYRYFSSKEHLFGAVFLEWQSALNVKLADVAPKGDSEADRVRDVFHRAISAFELQPQYFRVLMVLQTASDPYAARMLSMSGDLFRDGIQRAFDGWDDDREAIFETINAVLNSGLESWAMNRSSIGDVRRKVDSAMRLIYEFSPDVSVGLKTKTPRAARPKAASA